MRHDTYFVIPGKRRMIRSPVFDLKHQGALSYFTDLMYIVINNTESGYARGDIHKNIHTSGKNG